MIQPRVLSRLPKRYQRKRRRTGLASLEVVVTTAVMLPLAGLALFLGVRMLTYLYAVVAALVGWPFL